MNLYQTLYASIELGSISAVEHCVEHLGVDLNYNNCWANCTKCVLAEHTDILLCCVWLNRPEIALYLIQRGAKVTHPKLLHKSIVEKWNTLSHEILDRLTPRAVLTSPKNLLMDAIMTDQLDIFERLLNCGLEIQPTYIPFIVDSRHHANSTAICINMLKLVIKYSVLPYNTLHYACIANDQPIIEFLTQHCNINAVKLPDGYAYDNEVGICPLLLSAMNGHVNLVNLFISLGAKVSGVYSSWCCKNGTILDNLRAQRAAGQYSVTCHNLIITYCLKCNSAIVRDSDRQFLLDNKNSTESS